MEVTDTEIKSKEKLEQTLNLKKNGEFIINIPGMHPTEIIKIFKNHGVKHTHAGFKKWKLSHTEKNITINNKIIIIRTICLISTLILFTLALYRVFSTYWPSLELKFMSLPLGSGIISGIISGVILLIISKVFFKNPLAALKSYLGYEYD